jgi:two-component system OmpR family sensor kinase
MSDSHRLHKWVDHIPIRWRLTLVSLGLLTVLISALGIIILLTAEQALLNNEATALHNEAHLAVKGIHGHSIEIAQEAPGPPIGPPPLNFKLAATILVSRLVSASTNATVLSPTGSVIVPGSDLSLVPPPVSLSSAQIQRTLENASQGNCYLLVHLQGERQLVELMPIVSQHHTVAILQLSTPTTTIDEFITTLRLILLFGVISAISLAIALTFPLVGAALRPLVDMERTSRRIAGGALSMRLQTPHTDDEIGHLARSFNQMVSQLENAFKRQKQFVADVSHELRTPLTALGGSLEMLLIGADRGDVEATRRLARGMYAEIQRMNRLFEDLLALTRLDEGKIVLREDIIDLRTVIDKVYDQAQQLSHGQEVCCKIAPDTPRVRADSDRLQQVLLNVVHNSLKFTAADGWVELAAHSEGQASAVIEIRDNGKGIPPEVLPHVFDRFYRADPARAREPLSVGGSGLGLSIARELIEAQGGTISIDSLPDWGTTVTIRLPAILARQEEYQHQ